MVQKSCIVANYSLSGGVTRKVAEETPGNGEIRPKTGHFQVERLLPAEAPLNERGERNSAWRAERGGR
jgi:hypothetical protein